jgi:hypothetical protein
VRPTLLGLTCSALVVHAGTIHSTRSSSIDRSIDHIEEAPASVEISPQRNRSGGWGELHLW